MQAAGVLPVLAAGARSEIPIALASTLYLLAHAFNLTAKPCPESCPARVRDLPGHLADPCPLLRDPCPRLADRCWAVASTEVVYGPGLEGDTPPSSGAGMKTAIA